jgi:HD-GYP domain-containing protein (c-di-GMP phosphodiesterase class II)
LLGETIYYSYLNQIKDSRNYRAFNAVKEKLLEFPFISSDRVARIVKIINTYEAQDVAWGSDPTRPTATSDSSSLSSNSNPVLRSTLELQLALETVRQKAAEDDRLVRDNYQRELLSVQKNAYEDVLKQAREEKEVNNRLLILALLLIAGVCAVVFIVVIINLVLSLRSAKKQNEKFVETLTAVSELARLPPATVSAAALPPVFGANPEIRVIGSAMKETGLPPPPVTESEKSEFNALATKCREIGARIDLVTGRKNNSKNVAELVFKIAQEMGVAQYEATLFFSVGMVYDIGFLEIDGGLLLSDGLTEAQKYEIRNHVRQGLAQLSFVPEKYMAVFADGVLMHHENMDGTGYPEGLAGNRIPYVARLIRVAESFVALVSRRNYHDIYDKESAIGELLMKPGLYDMEIVNVLERII